MPVAALFHERKTEETHADFFRKLRKAVPNLNTPKTLLVTDRELAITNAWREEVPEPHEKKCR